MKKEKRQSYARDLFMWARISKNPKLKEIQQEKLPENFLVYGSTQSQAIEFLSDMNVVSKIKKFSEHMERLSITDKEPHLLPPFRNGRNNYLSSPSFSFTLRKGGRTKIR